MGLDRREFFRLSALPTAVPAVALATPAAAAPMSTLGIDAVQLGVRAGGTIDQTIAHPSRLARITNLVQGSHEAIYRKQFFFTVACIHATKCVMLHLERLRLKVGFGELNLTAVVSLLPFPDFAKALLRLLIRLTRIEFLFYN